MFTQNLKVLLFRDKLANNEVGLLSLAVTVVGLYYWLHHLWPVGMGWFYMIAGLLGGLTLFLFGMEEMEESLNQVAGTKMKSWLKLFTKNKGAGLVTGAGVTAIIQSSSVTTVLLVSFVSAGIMTFPGTVAVILGANIGTTITAQLLSFKITELATAMVAFGWLTKKASRIKNPKFSMIGSIVFGLGLIFLGMTLMSSAMKPLRDFQPFINLMTEMSNPLLGIMVGMVFTALVQSSSAALGVVIVLATGGMITLEAGIALVFGANIGTCITVMLAAIGKPVDAVRVAVVHVIFNVVGVVGFVLLIPYLAELVTHFSGDSVPRQIANAHAVFNIVAALLFLPFTAQLANFVMRILPDRPKTEIEEVTGVRPKFLMSAEEIYGPFGNVLALTAIRHEVHRMGRMVYELYNKALPAAVDTDMDILDRVCDDVIDVKNLGRLTIHAVSIVPNFQQKRDVELFGAVWDTPGILCDAATTVCDRLVSAAKDLHCKDIVITGETRGKILALGEIGLKRMDQVVEFLRVDESRLDSDEGRLEFKKTLITFIKARKDFKRQLASFIEVLQDARTSIGEENVRARAYLAELSMVNAMAHLDIELVKLVRVMRDMLCVEEPVRDEEMSRT